MSRLRAGDADAFDAVYAESKNTRLFAFLARLSRNRATAEDLLEETWLRLVSHAERLREDSQLGAWLFTVARNLYVSYCRSRMLEDVHALDSIGLWPSGCPSSPFEETAGHELGVRLEAALAELPLQYREALLLVAGIEGLTPSQAAQVCGVSGEAIASALEPRTRDARRTATSNRAAADGSRRGAPMTGATEDPFLRTLTELPPPVPRPEHTERVAHAMSRGIRQTPTETESSPIRCCAGMDAACFVVLGVYLAGAVTEALRLGRLL